METGTFCNASNQIDFNKTVIAQQDVNDFIRCIQEAGMNQKQTPRSTESWDRFFGICDREIQCALRRCHFQGADLDESTQEIWLKLLLSLPRFRFNSDRAQFTTWLQTVIRNHLIDHLRRRVLRKTVPLTDAADAKLSEKTSEPADILQRRAEKEFVDLVLRELKSEMPEVNHRILQLYWIEQKSISDIAVDTQWSPAQIRQRLCRMKQRLTQRMLSHPMKPR